MKLRTRVLTAIAYFSLVMVVTAIISAVGLKNIYSEVSVFHGQEIRSARAVLDQSFNENRLLLETENEGSENGELLQAQMRSYIEELVQKFVDFRVELKKALYQVSLQLGLMVILALVSISIYSVAIRRHMIIRLDKLLSFTRDLGVNDSHTNKRLALAGKDELSAIATDINRVLDAGHRIERKMIGRLNQERQILMSLIKSFHGKACLLRLNGDMIISNQDVFFDELVTSSFEAFLKKARSSRTMPILELEGGARFEVRKVGPNSDVWTCYLLEEIVEVTDDPLN